MNIIKSTYSLLFIIFIILQTLFLGCNDSFDVEENHFDDRIIGVWKRQGISDNYRWYFLKFTKDKIFQRFHLDKYYDVWEWEYFFIDSNVSVQPTPSVLIQSLLFEEFSINF